MNVLKVGDKAPDFNGLSQNEEHITLEQFKGKRVAIYFYPKDNTPGCTTQACNLRDNDALLKSFNVQIIGVSADNVQSHKKFAEKFHLPFPLIADTNQEILKSYGVWGPKKFMGKEYIGIHRTTFVLNENHEIIGVINKPNTKDHAEEVVGFFK
jgi:peroxiredoxin Q/BCP